MRTEVTVCQELYRAMVIHELLSVLMLTKALFPHYLELWKTFVKMLIKMRRIEIGIVPGLVVALHRFLQPNKGFFPPSKLYISVYKWEISENSHVNLNLSISNLKKNK